MNTEYDSNDEMYFHWYLMELKDNGFIQGYELQPTPFILSNEVRMSYTKPMKKVADKILSYSILNGHIYTPDAKIFWNEKSSKGVLYNNVGNYYNRIDDVPFLAIDNVSYVEIKPSHDFKNMTRLVKLNQKWVWDKHKEFVNIITPQKLFNETFTPGRFFLTDKSSTKRKLNYKNIKTINEFIK